MIHIFTLKEICKLLVANISGPDIPEKIKDKTVNTLLEKQSESRILKLTHKSGYPFKKIGENQYIRFDPYMLPVKSKSREFKGYLNYHD